ncbi:Peptidase S1 domain and Peptidase S1A, chymotrypsin-type family and Trypsin-like cysteine/serine peptidase domain-containing protein [Strongyloides ratti]|uniref:limulus clotting factor C n=1 Tax=Strongyloides ratti TaxID=34506 RepID=A0A090L679_STRRB|nr:Peptidase S1 domain and Peptidase S1A, chymotrypsin-type family and Trypsin-like cysteine/serine peptidase domain-containing protein [Strongyloides ratti]CEF65306.1 Peptidase S1 domain and Peptidase S1A, chymotrypsin-type family and Trypsin-like cysteine/serine peptidase domain-containing protein [Strongyloides ratti]
MLNFLNIFILLLGFSSLIYGNYSCGQTPIQPNLTKKDISYDIVGGNEAKPYSWPWQIVWCIAGWFQWCTFDCGGSIIAPGWVITAGHCVYGDVDHASIFRIKAGVYDESKKNETGETIHRIKKIHLHPQYNPDPDPSWDIALIELIDEITFSDHIQPVCLPTKDENVVVEPNSAWVTGWGTTSEGGSIDKKLKQVNIPFVNAKTCDNEYPHELKNDIMICAGRKGKDTCQGDSGGPLVVQSKSGRWFQYGITSFGSGCAEYRHPGIYSRITAFCDFINTTTNGNVTCIDSNIN